MGLEWREPKYSAELTNGDEKMGVVKLIAQCCLLLILLGVYIVAKRATSPTTQLPGPFWTRFTTLFVTYHDARSNRTLWTKALHEHYGPLVRLSPKEVSISSPASIRDVFTGSGRAGHCPKAPIFNIFQHFGARNAFSSIGSEEHAWRRKIIASSYTRAAVLGKEAQHGHIWTNTGRFLALVEREGLPTHGVPARDSKTVETFSACRFFAADNITAYLFVEGSHALAGDARARRAIETSAERPSDVMTYTKMEFESLYMIVELLLRCKHRRFRATPPGRARLAKASGTKVNATSTEWYGGTEIRDWGFRQYMGSRKAFEEGIISVSGDDPVSTKLAANAIAGERSTGTSLLLGDDTGIRMVVHPSSNDEFHARHSRFYRNEGCASECMDQLLAGLDTVGDTLSYILHLLSLEENVHVQASLRSECRSLALPSTFEGPLPSDKLAAIQCALYLDAVVLETLRLFPASTTAFQRSVPPLGRVLDGHFIPGGTIVGSSPVIINNNPAVFDGDAKFNVTRWLPERWLDTDAATVTEMNRRLWTFGSGPR